MLNKNILKIRKSLDKLDDKLLNLIKIRTTLVNQIFVRDNKKTVGQFLKETNPELKVTDFRRYSLSV